LAVKTASEMTYTVSGGALNRTQSDPMLASQQFTGNPSGDFTKQRLELVDTDYNAFEWHTIPQQYL